MESQEDDIKSMCEDMKNMFEVLWTVKHNDGRVGKDKTILDEKRNITFYEDYADGPNHSVSVPIDSVSAHDCTARYQRATTTKQATKKNP
jgi:hypothetical protein